MAWLKLPSSFEFIQPSTEMAPWFRDRLSSGIISATSNSDLEPRPKHSGQAPKGLLKEKLRGSISSMLTPQSGQAKLVDRFIGSPPMTSTVSRPSDRATACSMDSARRLPMPGRTTRRSTTISMVCRRFFSSLISSARSYILPSMRTRT